MKKEKTILILLLLLSITTTIGNTYTIINNWGSSISLFVLIICSLLTLTMWFGYVLVIITSLNIIYTKGRIDEIKELKRLELL